MNDPNEMEAYIGRLCSRYGATDLADLYTKPEFQTAYMAEQKSAPTLSAQSHVAKSLRSIGYISTPGVSLSAHCIEPNYVISRFDKVAGKSEPKNLGVLVCTPDGSTKSVTFADFDPMKPIEQQVPPTGWVPGLQRAAPVTLTNVTIFENLVDDETNFKLAKDSTVVAGGHSAPFPEGPDLDGEIGTKARAKGYGAWRVQKKSGTIRGRFGDGDNLSDRVIFVGTTTGDSRSIKVQDFEKDFNGNPVSPEDYAVAIPMVDRKGNDITAKLPLSEACRQAGIPAGSPKDVIAARLTNRRLLLCGQGNIFAGYGPSDFNGAFEPALAGLFKSGALETSTEEPEAGQKKKYVALNLNKVNITDDVGNTSHPRYINIGDKQVWDLQQRGTSWEASVLCYDDKRLPWFSAVVSKKTPREGKVAWNTGAFFLFLDGAMSEVSDSDPLMALAKQMPLPVFAR